MVEARAQAKAQAKARSSASSRGTPEPEPELVWAQVVGEFWLRLPNAYLWLSQRRRSAQALRDLWSAYARLGNKLRRSK